MIPGQRTDHVKANLEGSRIVVREDVLEAPTDNASDAARQFGKTVTMIDHTESAASCRFDPRHGGEQVRITPAFGAQILLDLYADSALETQVWTPYALRQTIQNVLGGWGVSDGHLVQWATLRYVRETSRAIVVVRASQKPGNSS